MSHEHSRQQRIRSCRRRHEAPAVWRTDRGAVLPLREQKRRKHKDADPCSRQRRRDGLRHRRRADCNDRRPAPAPDCRREPLPAARHSAPAHEHERQFRQIHLDRHPRSLRPVPRGSWPRTSTGRSRGTANTRGDQAPPRGCAKVRHHFALGMAPAQVTLSYWTARDHGVDERVDRAVGLQQRHDIRSTGAAAPLSYRRLAEAGGPVRPAEPHPARRAGRRARAGLRVPHASQPRG